MGFEEPASCSSGGSTGPPLASEGDNESVGPRGIIRKVEFVRVIAEALYSLGYKKSVEYLEDESGIVLHSSALKSFMQHVLDGNWDECVTKLHHVDLKDESNIMLASLMILEQKFSELLDEEKFVDALGILRSEIAPRCVNTNRVRELSFSIISSSQGHLEGASDQDTVKLKLRSELLVKLQRLCPPALMISEKRLLHLVEQALDLQRSTCRLHNSGVRQMSLLTNHQCRWDQLPTRTLQILQGHNNEVWFLEFSHGGVYLASSSSDSTVIIWEVQADGQIRLKHSLTGHQTPVSVISWSPDDKQLLSCGVEEVVRCWDVSSGDCLHIYKKGALGLVSCAWAPDGKSVFTRANNRSITRWNLEGQELEGWIQSHRPLKTSDLGIINNGRQMVFVGDTTLILLDTVTRAESLTLVRQPIISFALSQDCKSLLVNLYQEIHLWNLDSDIKFVTKYKGHKQSRFVVRSCFGGLGQALVASGSEDSQVYVWHRDSGQLLLTLPGHTGTVNCVSWNPVNHNMLASASDDHTIRIWGV